MSEFHGDRELQQDVADELDWDAAIDSHGLSVAVKAGIVTITGHVRHYSQQYEVERLAESIAGVREVIMRVEVQPKDVRDDAELARLAAVAVAATFDLGPNLLDIQVDNAWITLRGSVPWDFQRRNVVASIGALRGVRGITNASRSVRRTFPPAKSKRASIRPCSGCSIRIINTSR